MRCLGKGYDRVAVWGTLYMFASWVPPNSSCVKACEGLGVMQQEVKSGKPASIVESHGQGGRGLK